MWRRLRRLWEDRSDLTGQAGQIRPVDAEVAQYGAADAKALFSELLRRVQGGEVIVITRYGEPAAELVPAHAAKPTRPGVIRAHLVVHDATPAGQDDAATPTRSSPAASTTRREPRGSRPGSR